MKERAFEAEGSPYAQVGRDGTVCMPSRSSQLECQL